MGCVQILWRLSRARHLRLQDWANFGSAVWALGSARLHLRNLQAADLWKPPPLRAPRPGIDVAVYVIEVSQAVGRAAAIVPWRSDCLIQARAAQEWLARRGIESELKLGARGGAAGQLDAHAWLVCRGQIVTGGDISTFSAFNHP